CRSRQRMAPQGVPGTGALGGVAPSSPAPTLRPGANAESSHRPSPTAQTLWATYATGSLSC
ncbi:MAG TPA: hypothetical protein VGE97_10090, partial [Nitrososphaera sp.]